MSLDLYRRETAEKIGAMAPVQVPEAGAFDGFIRGAGLATMRGLAKTGRAIDLLGSVGPIAKDAVTGGTVLQDKYFQEHDEIWGSAVDYWTPKPNEVGVAGEITGDVLSGLMQVIASPALAVGSLQLSTAEDLVKKGVDATRAQVVGGVQAAGLGLGVWMPILGQNLWQRVVIGGAGFNVAQGVTTRAASQMILSGTPGADEFKAFDGTALTLDVLMGAAFGGIVHLSPKAREQGAAAWERLQTWAEGLTPTQKAAIVALRQAQHLNVDSTPGTPTAPADVEAHVNRLRTALEQLERGQRVNVDDMPEPIFGVDRARWEQAKANAERLQEVTERVAKNEDLPDARRLGIEAYLEHQRIASGEQAVRRAVEEAAGRTDAEGVPGFLRSAEQLVALRADQESAQLEPVVQRAIEVAKKPGFQRTAEEKVLLESILDGRLLDYLAPRNKKEESIVGAEVAKALKGKTRTEAPAAKPAGTEPPPPRGSGPGEAAGAEADPIRMEAERIAKEQPDRTLRVGTDAEGKPMTTTVHEYLQDARATAKQAADDAKLFEVAAACMLGKGS